MNIKKILFIIIYLKGNISIKMKISFFYLNSISENKNIENKEYINDSLENNFAKVNSISNISSYLEDNQSYKNEFIRFIYQNLH